MLECVALDVIASVLNQCGRSVVFLDEPYIELKLPSIEKEACAIIESIRRWRHYLTERRFTYHICSVRTIKVK